MQRDTLFGGKVKGKEDGGLVLNVFATKEVLAKPDSPVPVMVWIHGGAFGIGSGTTDMYSPVWLMDHGVVIVTINYRLGAFGFLSTGDNEIPANLGLWDQRMALVWVKENISKFGGDPDNVTIFGESAGSMSVCYHVLSPQSTGLFHKAIAQSGTPFSNFCRMDKHPASYTRKLVQQLGGDPKASTKELREFLEKKTAKDLLKITFVGKMFGEDSVDDPKEDFWFKPVVDDFCSKPFLPQEPIELLKSGKYNKVPFMTGFCKDEMSFFMDSFMKKKPSQVEKFNKNFSTFTSKAILGRDGDIELTDADKEATNLLIESYVGEKELTKDKALLDKYYTLISDACFLAPTMEFLNHLQEDNKTPSYLYRLSYPSPVSIGVFMGSVLKLMGRMGANKLFKLDVLRDKNNTYVNHGDDMFLMWSAEALGLTQRWTPEDIKVSETLMAMWTNFAKHGDPTPGDDLGFKWKPLQKVEGQYLEIDKETPRMMMDSVIEENLKTWREVYKQIGVDLKLERSPTWGNPLHGF